MTAVTEYLTANKICFANTRKLQTKCGDYLEYLNVHLPEGFYILEAKIPEQQLNHVYDSRSMTIEVLIFAGNYEKPFMDKNLIASFADILHNASQWGNVLTHEQGASLVPRFTAKPKSFGLRFKLSFRVED